MKIISKIKRAWVNFWYTKVNRDTPKLTNTEAYHLFRWDRFKDIIYWIVLGIVLLMLLYK